MFLTLVLCGSPVDAIGTNRTFARRLTAAGFTLPVTFSAYSFTLACFLLTLTFVSLSSSTAFFAGYEEAKTNRELLGRKVTGGRKAVADERG